MTIRPRSSARCGTPDAGATVIAVIDASVVARWILDEDGQLSAFGLLERLLARGETVRAPSLLVLEVSNAIYKRVRRGVFRLDEAQTLVKQLLEAPLRLVDTSPLQVLALELADRFGLPATYDAHYLALAQVESDTLWTADRELFGAAAAELPYVRWSSRMLAPAERFRPGWPSVRSYFVSAATTSPGALPHAPGHG